MSIYKEYGELFIDDDEMLTWIGAGSALGLAIAKIVSATLLDYFSFLSIYYIVLVFLLAHILTIHLAVKNEWAYFSTVFVLMSVDGGFNAMMPVLTLNIFGMRRGPQVYSLIQMGSIISGLSAVFVISELLPYIGYDGVFFMGLCTTLLGAILS